MVRGVLSQVEQLPRRRVLRDDVLGVILEMLLNGEVEAGEPIGIDALSAALGVSQTPVREALVRLEHTGLVERVALKGYRAAPPLDPTRMVELLETRQIIEVAAVELAVPASHEVVESLQRAHLAHEAASIRAEQSIHAKGAASDWRLSREYFTADWAFHSVLLEASHNRYLWQVAESLSPHLHRMRQSGRHGPGDMTLAVAEHSAILRAVESRDTDAAVAAMRTHLTNVETRAKRQHATGTGTA